ncbi:MAG: NADH-quinone oxidoreductase subunit J [Anaerolineae bacterium]|nr:NADH-quinone oxidoreductase subunit J [Anaerolineae bacterium]
MSIGYVLLAVLLLTGAAGAVFSRRLIMSALLLGVGSVALAGLFFLMGAPYAGGFELSVGAGLISVLFIVAISLTRSAEVRGETDEG